MVDLRQTKKFVFQYLATIQRHGEYIECDISTIKTLEEFLWEDEKD